MNLVATMKLKIVGHRNLLDMSKTFLHAVQYAVDRGFEAKVSNKFKLQRLVYRDLRQWLPADFAIEALANASETLKSVKLKKRPIMKSCPVSFNRKLFTFSFDKVRLATFTPRQRRDVPITVPEYYWKYLDWRYQTLELITDRKGRMFFHITFSREVPARPSCRNEHVVGVDLGVNNLAVTSDGQVFQSPKTKLMQFHYLRRRLQRKGTPSALRKLHLRKGRQQRFMRDVNHCISKTIAHDGIVVMEDLTGIREGKNRYRGNRMNRWLHNWAYRQLQTFTDYKTVRLGGLADYWNPYLSSQTCSACGQLGRRYGDSFVCMHCGFAAQSDFNAACTLRRLSVNQPIVTNHDIGPRNLMEFSHKPPVSTSGC